MKTLEEMPVEQFEATIQQFIQNAAEWDGSLPIETFFEAWEALEQQRTILEIKAQVVSDRLMLVVPADSPLTVQGNRILLEDGREVVITLMAESMTN